MPTVLRVRDWDKNFETHETRKLKHMLWISMPIKQDGDGYTDLVLSTDDALGAQAGPLRLAAWVAMLQLAGRCSPRGTLWRSTGTGPVPHDANSIARITRLPAAVIASAIPKLLEIGWLEEVDTKTNDPDPEPMPHDLPASPGEPGEDPDMPGKSSGRREGKGREGKGMEGTGVEGTAPGPAGCRPSGEPPSKPQKARERLVAILKANGCSMEFKGEPLLTEWCNVIDGYPLDWIEHLMGKLRQRAHMPSGLRKILKNHEFEYAAWKAGAPKEYA